MVNKDRWAIIGGGNGGQALAAFFSIKGKKENKSISNGFIYKKIQNNS